MGSRSRPFPELLPSRLLIACRFAVLLTALAGLSAAADPAPANVPVPRSELRQALHRLFPSWRPTRCIRFEASPALYTIDYFKSEATPPPEHRTHEAPCQVTGDFDGNGETDVAVQLERPGPSPRRQIVVVVFRREGQLMPVYAGEGADTLGVAKKGSRDWDYETERRFRHETDAVCVGLDERAGYALIYRGNRFLTVQNSD